MLVVLSVAASGCVTMRLPSAYKVEGQEFKEFKELDDERALKLVALIYNVKFEAWEDNIARSIALEEYLNLLKKRGSRYIRKSGIFNIKYDKARLSKWKDEDLEKLFDNLAPKTDAYYMETAPELTEVENARRIIYLTAINSVEREFKKRNNTRTALAVAGDILVGILTVAMSMI